MVKIQRLPSGNYRARVHIGNGKYKSITGKDKKAVQLEAAQLEANIETQSVCEDPNENMTVGEAMLKYIADKEFVLAPTSVREYTRSAKNDFLCLKNIKLFDLTQQQVQAAVNEESKTHASKTVRSAHGFLSAVLSLYRPTFKLNTTLPQPDVKEMLIPEEHEIQALLAVIKGTDAEIPISLAACCGMSRSEICGLRWKNVDLDKGVIKIKESMTRDKDYNLVHRNKNKTTSRTRTIRLYPFILEALKNAPRESEFVTNLNPDQVYKRFKKAMAQVNPDSPYRLHDLRHYFVSVALSLNIPKNYIVSYVGHKDTNMIDKVYGHIMAEKKTEMEDLLQDHFSRFK